MLPLYFFCRRAIAAIPPAWPEPIITILLFIDIKKEEFDKRKQKAKEKLQLIEVGEKIQTKLNEIEAKIKEIKEFNIGHFIIGESIFIGLSSVIKKFKKIIKN